MFSEGNSCSPLCPAARFSRPGGSPFQEGECQLHPQSRQLLLDEKSKLSLAALENNSACHAGGRGFEPRHSRQFPDHLCQRPAGVFKRRTLLVAAVDSFGAGVVVGSNPVTVHGYLPGFEERLGGREWPETPARVLLSHKDFEAPRFRRNPKDRAMMGSSAIRCVAALLVGGLAGFAELALADVKAVSLGTFERPTPRRGRAGSRHSPVRGRTGRSHPGSTQRAEAGGAVPDIADLVYAPPYPGAGGEQGLLSVAFAPNYERSEAVLRRLRQRR